jgi:hypothetical protein
MDAVSIDSERAELGAADANDVVCPLRVESESGQVTNVLALVTGHHHFATLKWSGIGSRCSMWIMEGRRGRHFRM